MLKEFKEFALRGNVMDMAVGIIIGAAFATIINSKRFVSHPVTALRHRTIWSGGMTPRGA